MCFDSPCLTTLGVAKILDRKKGPNKLPYVKKLFFIKSNILPSNKKTRDIII